MNRKALYPNANSQKTRMNHCLSIVLSIWVAMTASVSLKVSAASNELPALGDSTSGLVSLNQEHQLGRTWLRQLRAQAPMVNDPLINDYVSYLIYKLATHSEVQDRRFEIIIVDSKQLNAFAVPGGIIGINAGLFLYSDTEDQFASVMAHELAHLSQRHFARQIDAGRRQAPVTLATMLASILLIATDNAEMGFAGLMTSQAAAQQSRLSYSRDWEREADRIGMKTLAESGFSPQEMPRMFENMYDSHKYSGRPPEFLLTHPVTESRISDSAGRAQNYPDVDAVNRLIFQFMRTRIELMYVHTSGDAVKVYQHKLDNAKTDEERAVSRYGLTLALLNTKQADEAAEALEPLINKYPDDMTLIVAKGEVLLAQQKYQESKQYLREHVSHNPDNHPLTMLYAEALSKVGEYIEAEALLKQHTLNRRTDPYLWITLAETQGKTKNQVGVHESTAEYYFYTGRTNLALMQLEQAAKLTKDQYQVQARIQQRIKEMKGINNDLTF